MPFMIRIVTDQDWQEVVVDLAGIARDLMILAVDLYSRQAGLHLV
jgi:hypothetical protein